MYLPITKPMSHPPTKNAAMIGNTMMFIIQMFVCYRK